MARIALAAFFLFLIPIVAFEARAGELPPAAEVAYARAVVAFNASKFDDSLKLLGEVLTAAPRAYAAQELKALALKAKKQDIEALKVYGELARSGPGERKSRYYFEIGTLLHRTKRYAQARPYLNAAIEGKFNVGACRYFLGVIDFEDKQWEAAEHNLIAATLSDARDLHALAYFHLGLLYYRTGYSIGAIRGLRYAREGVVTWRDSPDPEQKKSGEEITDATRRLLKTMDRVRWFGNLTTMTQYDSNAALLPGAVTIARQLDGKHTMRQLFTGGGGFMSSPTRVFQAVASYRTYFNYNFNPDAKSFDFFSHLPSLHVNYKPYMRLTPGVKIDGNYTFQNLSGRESSIEFHPYSLTAEIGPYGRYEVNPHLHVMLEGLFLPQKYFVDPELGNDRRTGDGYIFRLSGEYVSPWKYLLPSAYLAYANNLAEGQNWEFQAWNFGFTNTMRFDPLNTLQFAMDLAFSHFTERTPRRDDSTIATRLLWSHVLTRHFAFLADFNYIANHSNLESLYSYSRVFGGVGLSYTF